MHYGPRGAPRGKTGKCSAPSEAMVTSVVDGDTVVVEGGFHVRLSGIDAEERGYPCYYPANPKIAVEVAFH